MFRITSYNVCYTKLLRIWQFNFELIFAKHNLYFIIASLLWPALTIVSSKSVKTNPIMFTFYVYLIVITSYSIHYTKLYDHLTLQM